MTKTKIHRHGVTLDAVVHRLNRRLHEKDHIVRAPRGRRRGERKFFIVNPKTGAMVANDLTVDQIEKLARKDGVLQPWEEVK
jgi:hypothetical protein